LDAYAITQVVERATEPTALPLERRPSVAERLRPSLAAATAPDAADLGPGHLLLEGWATALAYRLADGLSEKGKVTLDRRLPQALHPWATNALYALESSGLATLEKGVWRLRRDVSLPAPEETMRWIAADHPELAAELVLLADTTAMVGRIVAG
ncbi:hypothetical protein NLK88_27400, partial [Klebsiella pneumoniae]|uniref:hypothetical protein n=1 Tax=Klebsiella pneumoniae TaxID=573 RepID=UPI0021D1F816